MFSERALVASLFYSTKKREALKRSRVRDTSHAELALGEGKSFWIFYGYLNRFSILVPLLSFIEWYFIIACGKRLQYKMRWEDILGSRIVEFLIWETQRYFMSLFCIRLVNFWMSRHTWLNPFLSTRIVTEFMDAPYWRDADSKFFKLIPRLSGNLKKYVPTDSLKIGLKLILVYDTRQNIDRCKEAEKRIHRRMQYEDGAPNSMEQNGMRKFYKSFNGVGRKTVLSYVLCNDREGILLTNKTMVA